MKQLQSYDLSARSDVTILQRKQRKRVRRSERSCLLYQTVANATSERMGWQLQPSFFSEGLWKASG